MKFSPEPKIGDQVYEHLANTVEGELIFRLYVGMMRLQPTQRITPEHALKWIHDMRG